MTRQAKLEAVARILIDDGRVNGPIADLARKIVDALDNG